MDPIELQRIELYLRGELEGDELKAFEDKMQTDKAFATEVELRKGVSKAITDNEVIRLRKLVKKAASGSANKEKNKGSIIRMTYLKYAAAVVLLLLASLPFIYNSIGGLDNDTLYTTYYTPYDAENLRSDADMASNRFRLGLSQYKGKNYTEALKLLEEEVTANPDDMQSQFLIAHCYLHLDQIQNATTSFEQVVTHGKSTLIHEARWFMALTHLKSNELDKTKAVLNEIISGNSGRKKQVEKLLGDIQELDNN